MLLQTMVHDTRVVHDGIEALEEAEVFQPEIVLLDIGMPRLLSQALALKAMQMRGSSPSCGST